MKWKSIVTGSVIATGCGGSFATDQGDNGPRPGVLVSRLGDHYDVSILNCGDPKWAGLPISSVTIGRSPPGLRADVQCELRASSAPRGAGGNLTKWRYGSQPEGYMLQRCAVLEPGLTYEIHVHEMPSSVLGHFKVMSNGDVTMIDGNCPK